MDKNQKKNKNKNISSVKDQFAKPEPPHRFIIPQNETLYVNHLNEKINLDLLRENLYYLFSQFGDVLEINVRKSKKMRGQAFIVYKDINEATRAKVSLNNFLFLGSRISVDYAKTKSDIIVKIKGQNQPNNINGTNNIEYQKTGTYISRKRKRMIEYGNIKEEKEEDKKIGSNNEEEDENEEKEKEEDSQKEKEKNEVKIEDKKSKNKNNDKNKSNENKEEEKDINNNNIELNEEEDIDGEIVNENKILFVTGLGSEINEKMIEVVFKQFKGLKDIRFFNGRGFCFVEYDNEVNAGTALMSLNNMKLTETTTMKISYAIKK